MRIYFILLNDSSIDENLRFFFFFFSSLGLQWITRWTVMCKSIVEICFHFLCVLLGVELLGHMDILCLIVWRISKLFSRVFAKNIFNNNIQELSFFHIFANIYCCWVFFYYNSVLDYCFTSICFKNFLTNYLENTFYPFMYVFISLVVVEKAEKLIISKDLMRPHVVFYPTLANYRVNRWG